MKNLLVGLVMATASLSVAATEGAPLQEANQKCFALKKKPQAGLEITANPVCDEAISQRIMAAVTLEMEARFAKTTTRIPPR